MANEQNLIPASQRSKNEARENSRKGGIASGKARRRKKALRAVLKEAVAMQLNELHPDMQAGIMKAARISDGELTVGDAILGSIIRNACRGNSQMAKLLLDVLGETPDVRIRERELKLKERAMKVNESDDAVDDVQIMMPEKEMEI